MALTHCRSDPTLVLADGRHLKVLARVDASVGSIDRMAVVVRGPSGTALERVLYVGPDRFPESVDYLADGSGSGFVIEVTLTATVDAAATISAQLAAVHAEASGRTNAAIRVTLTP